MAIGINLDDDSDMYDSGIGINRCLDSRGIDDHVNDIELIPSACKKCSYRGYVFIGLIIFVIGCIRGQYMEYERAEKLINSGKPFYVLKNGISVYLYYDTPT